MESLRSLLISRAFRFYLDPVYSNRIGYIRIVHHILSLFTHSSFAVQFLDLGASQLKIDTILAQECIKLHMLGKG